MSPLARMQVPAGPGATREAQRGLLGRLRGSRRLTWAGLGAKFSSALSCGGRVFFWEDSPLIPTKWTRAAALATGRPAWTAPKNPKSPTWARLPWVGLWPPHSGGASAPQNPVSARLLTPRRAVPREWSAPTSCEHRLKKRLQTPRLQCDCAHDYDEARSLLRRSRQAL